MPDPYADLSVTAARIKRQRQPPVLLLSSSSTCLFIRLLYNTGRFLFSGGFETWQDQDAKYDDAPAARLNMVRIRRTRLTTAAVDPNSVVPHIAIFNDTYLGGDTAADGSPTFPVFPRFPPEIRLKIWQSFLQRRRLIQLELAAARRGGGGGDERAPPYTTRNDLGRVLSGDEFHPYLHASPPLCQLLEVCHEARQVALAFFRVRLPCHTRSQFVQWKGVDEPARSITVYLNPEWDFLFITRYGSGKFLVDFLHDFRAHDPRSRGIQHLVLRLPMFGGVNPRDVREPGRPAFVETLTNLQSFWVDFSADSTYAFLFLLGPFYPPRRR